MKPRNGCLWNSIRDELAVRIRTGKLKPGDPFLSADELSANYKVSNITSRRVLDELAAMNLIRRVKGKGSFIKGPPPCDEIFLVVESDVGLDAILRHYIYNAVSKGVGLAAAEAGINVTTVSPDYVALAAESKKKLNVVMIRGILKNKTAAEYLASPEVNCVCCHAVERCPGIVTIVEPLKEGAILMTEHLVAEGHERIAFMMPASAHKWFKSRFDGYYETLMRHGKPFGFDLVKEVSEEYESVCMRMDELRALPEPPSALFCATDAIALHVLRYCRENGVRVPKELAVAGFDNRIECEIANPPLTSVDTRWEEQGRRAVSCLLQMASGRKIKGFCIGVRPELVVRESA